MRNPVFRRGAIWATLAVCVLLALCPCALAEDCFTLDVDVLDMNSLNSNEYVALHLSAQAQGLRVRKFISDSGELAEPVRLTLTQMDTQTLLFDKDYGYQSNTFLSDAIYLPYGGNRTAPYLVTLYVGNTVYAMPFMQLQPRLEYNGACTYGLRLNDLGLSGDWLMATMLDLNELRFTGATALDVCASNAYVIGQAIVMMENEAVAVELSLFPAANAQVHGLSLYLIPDCASLMGDPLYGGFPAHTLGEWIDVSGASSALLYMPMQISYDPAGLGGFGYDPAGGYLQSQRELWEGNRAAAFLADATPVPEAPVLAETLPQPDVAELPITAEGAFPETPVESAVLPEPPQAEQPLAAGEPPAADAEMVATEEPFAEEQPAEEPPAEEQPLPQTEEQPVPEELPVGEAGEPCDATIGESPLPVGEAGEPCDATIGESPLPTGEAVTTETAP